MRHVEGLEPRAHRRVERAVRRVRVALLGAGVVRVERAAVRAYAEQAEQLDDGFEGTVFRIPGFLSDDEIAHVLQTVAPSLNFDVDKAAATPTHRRAHMVGAGLAAPHFSDRYRDAKDYVERYSPAEEPDEVLNRIEERIGDLTGVPFHDHELPFELSHAWPVGAKLTKFGPYAGSADEEENNGTAMAEPYSSNSYLPTGRLEHAIFRYRHNDSNPGHSLASPLKDQ